MATAYVTTAADGREFGSLVDEASEAALELVRGRGPAPLGDVLLALADLPDLQSEPSAASRQVVSKALLNLLDDGRLVLDSDRLLSLPHG